jgi:hypothetical protein
MFQVAQALQRQKMSFEMTSILEDLLRASTPKMWNEFGMQIIKGRSTTLMILLV